jgi:branched-chain amino acid transport system permease protein
MKAEKHTVKILAWICAVVILIAAPIVFDNIYWVSLFILIAIKILLTSSVRIIWLTGQISLGHAGFMLIGAYTSALLVMKASLSFWLALPIGGLTSALVALVLGFPFLRVRGIYFTILTVLTAESFRHLAYNWWTLTGGRTGLLKIPSPGMLAIPGLGKIDFTGLTEYYYLTLAVVSISLLILYLIEKSRYGFTWHAIRESSELAGTVGVNVINFNVLNFVISSFFAGIAGSLFAHFQHTLSADARSTFGVMTTIYLLVYMVVGGERRFAGAIIGVLTLTLIFEFARSLGEYQPMLIGGIAMLVVTLMPEGLVGLPHRIGTALQKTKSSKPGQEG